MCKEGRRIPRSQRVIDFHPTALNTTPLETDKLTTVPWLCLNCFPHKYQSMPSSSSVGAWVTQNPERGRRRRDFGLACYMVAQTVTNAMNSLDVDSGGEVAEEAKAQVELEVAGSEA